MSTQRFTVEQGKHFQAMGKTQHEVIVKMIRSEDKKTAQVIFEDRRPSREMNIEHPGMQEYFDERNTNTIYAEVTLSTPGVMPLSQLEVDFILEGEDW